MYFNVMLSSIEIHGGKTMQAWFSHGKDKDEQ
jgi:hypothetical protein